MIFIPNTRIIAMVPKTVISGLSDQQWLSSLDEEASWGRLFDENAIFFLFFKEVQWNLGYSSKSGLKNLDVGLRGTYTVQVKIIFRITTM